MDAWSSGCYVFDTPVGRSEKLLLLSMSAIKLSGIDVNYHIDQSFEGRCAPLKFKDKLRPTGETHSRAETYYYKIDRGDLTPCDLCSIYNTTTTILYTMRYTACKPLVTY